MLMALNVTMIALLVIIGVVLDLILGEVRRWHPLVGFGRLANGLERRLNQGERKYWTGALAWLLAVLPLVLLAYWSIRWSAVLGIWASAGIHAVLLYFSLGLRSLRDHALPIERALAQNDLARARRLTARIVSRDTAQADASSLARAGVESLLENGNDAVFGTLFWFMVAGGPGAVLFRLANTLDAMWGYRTPRHHAFGCVAARIDDALNWIPARLTALSYALLGNTRQALRCWHTQAPDWSSPNAGPVMAAGAGALGLALGGAAVYDGVIENRPALGSGCAARATDIGRAWRLVAGTTALWMVMLSIAACISFLKG
ncbi:cobalamin biosynthesis protein CobD [Sulfuriferula plumbiphila]|uniref:Cobalamin biosynthesis protein CobD n=1 Tax=Sulfuriferula plumbiphila TaxID=171865 RepID=A0A512L9X3_9PROT|nr:adenosylcobinamide-phosphate synthase CbiB [Sulfuriferula plumbiphila]BBP05226.1 cobalamin biosynthesis protein CobD [Sulfuriferula plumbiphila]GEP31285.1 cobalamin biosynthesis protein CobD [Sulfuriferula plumbiphila]